MGAILNGKGPWLGALVNENTSLGGAAVRDAQTQGLINTRFPTFWYIFLGARLQFS